MFKLRWPKEKAQCGEGREPGLDQNFKRDNHTYIPGEAQQIHPCSPALSSEEILLLAKVVTLEELNAVFPDLGKKAHAMNSLHRDTGRFPHFLCWPDGISFLIYTRTRQPVELDLLCGYHLGRLAIIQASCPMQKNLLLTKCPLCGSGDVQKGGFQ